MTWLRAIPKIPRAFLFALFFVRQLVIANLQLAFEIVTPRHHMNPAIVRVPTAARTDLERTILANLISLTPGTLTLEIAENGDCLYVHGIQVPSTEEFRAHIGRLEAKLLEVMR